MTQRRVGNAGPWPLGFGGLRIGANTLLSIVNLDLALTLMSRGLAVGGLLVVSVLTARALGPIDRGRYFLVVAYAQLAAQFGSLGLQSSNTYYCANRPRRAAELLIQSLLVSTVASAVAAAALAITIGWSRRTGAADGARVLGGASLISVVMAPMTTSFLLINNMAVALGRVRLFNLMLIFNALLAAAAAAVAGLLGCGLVGFLAAALVASFLANLCSYHVLAKGWMRPRRLNWRLLRVSIGYGTRSFLSTLSGFGISRAPALALQAAGQMQGVGYLSVAQQIADALSLAASTIGLLVFPRMVRAENEMERWKLLRVALPSTLVIMLGVAAGVIIVVGPATRLLFGQAYSASVPLTIYLMPSVIFLALITIISQYLSAGGFPWKQVGVWLIAAPISGFGSYVMARQMSALGVVGFQAFSYGAIAIALGAIALSRHRAAQRA